MVGGVLSVVLLVAVVPVVLLVVVVAPVVVVSTLQFWELSFQKLRTG